MRRAAEAKAISDAVVQRTQSLLNGDGCILSVLHALAGRHQQLGDHVPVGAANPFIPIHATRSTRKRMMIKHRLVEIHHVFKILLDQLRPTPVLCKLGQNLHHPAAVDQVRGKAHHPRMIFHHQLAVVGFNQPLQEGRCLDIHLPLGQEIFDGLDGVQQEGVVVRPVQRRIKECFQKFRRRFCIQYAR